MRNLAKTGKEIYAMFSVEIQEKFKKEFIEQNGKGSKGEKKFKEFLKDTFEGGITEFVMSCFDFDKTEDGRNFWFEETSNIMMRVREDAKFTLILGMLSEKMPSRMAMSILIASDMNPNDSLTDDDVYQMTRDDKKHLIEGWAKLDDSPRSMGRNYLEKLPVEVQNSFIIELDNAKRDKDSVLDDSMYSDMGTFLKSGFPFDSSLKGIKYWLEVVKEYGQL